MTIASANRACLCRLGSRTTRKFGTRLAQQLWVTPQTEFNHVLNQQWTHKDPRKNRIEGMCLAAPACSSTLKSTSIVPYIISTCKRVCTVLLPYRIRLHRWPRPPGPDHTSNNFHIHKKERGRSEGVEGGELYRLGSGEVRGDSQTPGESQARGKSQAQRAQNGPNSCFTSEAL